MRSTLTSAGLALAAAGVVVALAGCAESGSSSGPGQAAAPIVSSAAPSPVTTPTPVAEIPSLSGVHSQVILDPGFLQALDTLKLKPGTIGTATLKNGTLTFPITGGNVTYYDPTKAYRPYVQGEIDHDGSGLSLSAGGKKVSLENFVIDPGDHSHISGEVLLNGDVVAQNVDLFRLDGSTLQPLTKDAAGDAVLYGTTVYVSDDAAALLDKTFGTTAVTGDLKVGVAKLTVD